MLSLWVILERDAGDLWRWKRDLSDCSLNSGLFVRSMPRKNEGLDDKSFEMLLKLHSFTDPSSNFRYQ